MKAKRLFLRALGAALIASMAATELALLLEGRWQEAIPMHLCSISALVSACLAFFPRQAFFDFLWYMGMPGAALALVFPAPAVSERQALLNLSYVTTHALILVIPICLMALGMRPRRGRTGRMLLVLLGIAAAAGAANRLLGANFLFLDAPAPGTPLERLFALGRAPYLFALFAMMSLLCAAMDSFAGRIAIKRGQ